MMDKIKKIVKRSWRRTNRAGFAILEAYQAAVFKERLSKLEIPPFSLLAVIMVRDEALRLPYFFEYYRELGVDCFLVIDHQSTDETAKVIAEENTAVHIEIVGNFAFKRAWLQAAVSHLSQDKWCLVLDADEFLVWPNMDSVSLNQLTAELEAENADAFSCSLIDMYPRCKITEVDYKAGENPLDYAPFFDRRGDTRERVFGVSPLLEKVPLMRLRPGHYLSKGQHNVRKAARSRRSGALLHFKFLQDFKGKIRTNSMIKKFDPQYNTELEAYRERVESRDEFVLYNESSVKYEGVDQLVELGFVKS